MEASWKQRKGVVALLVVIALGVWTAVAFSIADGLKEDDEITDNAHQSNRPSSEQSGFDRSAFTYTGDFQDPFAPQLPVVRVSTTDPSIDEYDEVAGMDSSYPDEVDSLPPDPPELRLVAVVGETAVVELPDGATQVVRAGDYVGSVIIRAISETTIRVDAWGWDFVVPLN